MKRLIVCFDGTWQTLEQTHETNIAIIARSIAHADRRADGSRLEQFVIYSQGVGATTDALGKRGLIGAASDKLTQLAGGAFGDGLEDALLETYVRLAFNFEADDEIFLFGFSRGAFMARSLAGMISTVGIISRRFMDKAWDGFKIYRSKPRLEIPALMDAHLAEARDFRLKYGKGRRDAQGERIQTDDIPKIAYMGIFDTVGQRGAPDAFGWISKMMNRRYGFHNLKPCDNVQSARHAVAIDECRLGFPPTLWDDLAAANQRVGRQAFEQRWFVGMHGDVGGGIGSSLSAAPLQWIVEGAEKAGLKFYATDESPYRQALAAAGRGFDAPIDRPRFGDWFSLMSMPVRTRHIWRERKKEPTEVDAEDNFHPTVVQRVALTTLRPRYQPRSVRPFRKAFKSLVARDLAARAPDAVDAKSSTSASPPTRPSA